MDDSIGLNPFGSLAALPPLAMPGQVIGLLGGSFNPAHAGHRVISLVALKRLGLDRIWWMVTPGNPLKSRAELAPLEDRLARGAEVAGDRRIILTDFEKDLAAPYTVTTLAHLRLRFPRVRFVWIMGADCLAEFHRWRQWRQIFRTMPIAVVDRPGWRLKALASPAARTFVASRVPESAARLVSAREAPCWTFLTSPLVDLSSTQIRALERGVTRLGPVADHGGDLRS